MERNSLPHKKGNELIEPINCLLTGSGAYEDRRLIPKQDSDGRFTQIINNPL